MRLTTLLLISAILQVSASTYAQKISLSEKNATLSVVFDKISDQSGYDFVFTTSILKSSKPVSISVQNKEFEEVLREIFNNQPLSFSIKRKTVVISLKEPSFLDRMVDALTLPVDVSGSVVDENGKGLPGVTVKVKGSGKATSTDNNGRFYLAGVDDDAILEFRLIGYKIKELPVKSKFDMVQLEIASKDLEEVVVAYGKTTQQALTGAVTVVKGEQIENLPNRSFDKSLQGLVPGLQITGGTGQPGGGVANMVLRGISTGADASSGSTVRNPLIVVDGIPVTQDNFQISMLLSSTPISNPIAQLNPSDIESISILKDASAIALYGSKASNGVILITTKKGKSDKTSFSFRSQLDVSVLPNRKQDILNQEQYLQLLYETYKNTNPAQWTNAEIRKDLLSKFPYIISGRDTSFYAAPDWLNAMYDRAAPTISNDLSMSGANDKSNFYLNFEYTKQSGIVRKTGFDRKSIRFNFENKPAVNLTIGTKTMLSYNEQDYLNAGEGESSFGVVPTISPLNPIRAKDGNYIWNFPWGGISSIPMNNPVASAEFNISKNVVYRGLSSIYAQLSLLKYFVLSSNIGVDFMLAETKEKIDPRFRQASSSTFGSIADRDRRRANIISSNTLLFKMPVFAKQDISLLIGQEAQIMTERAIGGDVRGNNTALPIYDQLTSPGYSVNSLVGNKSRQTLLSYFGQLNYDYDKKYYLSSSIRRDGSSRFGSRQQWGTYWSVGGAWVLTEEPIFKEQSFLSYLKARGSFGIAGNSAAVGPSTRYDVLRQSLYQDRTALLPQLPGNPDIRWEKTFSWDAGLEMRLWKDRISLTTDVYKKETSDVIYPIDLPSPSGFSSVMYNIGDITNKGLELSISALIYNKSAFQWRMNANWSTNANVLTKAYIPKFAIQGTSLGNEEGRNFNSFFLPEWLGVNPMDGKPLWLDSMGKGTSNFRMVNRSFVGKPQPDGFGAISSVFMYKGWEMMMQFYYQYGFQVLNEKLGNQMNDGTYPYINQSVAALQYWKKPGDIAPNPRRLLNNADGGRNPSTRFLFDGDYIRFSTLMLSYSFRKEWLQQLRLKYLKLYLQGNNLALWSKMPSKDPDNANPMGAFSNPYPNARTFSFGVQINF